MKLGHIYYQRGGFRVVGTIYGTYHVQAKVFVADPQFKKFDAKDLWASIETFDYLANARARVRRLHEASCSP